MVNNMKITCGWCGKEFDICGSEYNKQVRNGRTLFFCNLSHAAHYNNSRRSEGNSKSVMCQRARDIWFKIYGSEPLCEFCGKPADVHHEDGNRDNNSKENLRALCRSHHVTLENFRRGVRSEETKQKISKTLIGRKLSKEHKHNLSKPYPAFIHKETREIIPMGVNLEALCRKLGLNSNCMRDTIKGRQKSHKGWILYIKS